MAADGYLATRLKVRERLLRLAMYDEPHTAAYPAHAMLADTLLDLIERYSPRERWPMLFQNPVGNYDGFRRLQFDLDSTRRMRVHMMARQLLPMFIGPIPIYYVRPDKMARPGVDSTQWRRFYPDALIAFNTPAGYARYTDSIQAGLGIVRDTSHIQSSTHWRIIPTLVRIVSASRFRYAGRVRDSVPVYNVVTVNGLMNHAEGSKSPTSGWKFSVRPKTPEEIAVQAFITLNCGAQGIEFDDLAYDGLNLGIADRRYGVGRVDWSRACDTSGASLAVGWQPCDKGEWDWANPPEFTLTAPRDSLRGTPHMWLGFRSRYLAVKRVVEEMRRIAPTYERLYYRMEQMSVHDPLQSFSSIPMIAALYAEQADTSRRDDIAPYATPRLDTRTKTYIELTHFYPGSRDTAGIRNGTRTIALTNRRTFPIDFARYGAASRALDTNNRDSGFGFIDVRRPWIVLKNSTGVIADSFLIEKVGHEDSLHWRVEVGDTVKLDWLEPGWGGLYRLTPIARGISLEGTAYNNAVHSENPTWGLLVRDRISVFERDSIVYLRMLSPTGTWGRELRVSDSLDSADAPCAGVWRRPAANFHPAVALVRDSGGTSCMIVWERDSAGAKTIEARMLQRMPTSLDSALPRSLRFTVAPPRPPLARATAHAPAVVGIDGGYVVAWPSGGTAGGISVTLVRDVIATDTVVRPSDTLTKHHIRWPSAMGPFLIDSAYFPTLAHRRHTDTLLQGEGHWQCVVGGGETPPKDGEHSGLIVHLAYQQGKLDTVESQHVMYNMLACSPMAPGIKPVLWVSPTEHVSALLPGCGFLHPSIAADAFAVGVAMQAHSFWSRRPLLRFRQSDSALATYPQWRTAHYTWGATNQYHEWPSLTMFPAAAPSDLYDTASGAPMRKGALVWFRTNTGANPRTQHLYCFGAQVPAHIDNGEFPTMTLVSRRSILYYDASSVFYRGDATRGFAGDRPCSTTATYYPAILLNGALTPSAYLRGMKATPRSTVMSGTELQGEPDFVNGCSRVRDLKLGIVTPFDKGPNGPMVPPGVAGLPPAFFATGERSEPPVETLAGAARITRTATFEAGPTPVTMTRHLSRSADLVAWLATQPYDSALMSPADVRVITELVRDDDGVVLWSDDTISVRSMTADTLEGEIALKSELQVPGTRVFGRVRLEPTAGLDYVLAGGFAWSEDTATTMSKPTRWMQRTAPAPGATGLELTLTPNPARREVTIGVASMEPTSVRVSIVDAVGRDVRMLPSLESGSGVISSVTVDVSTLPAGTYIVRAKSTYGSTSRLLGVIHD